MVIIAAVASKIPRFFHFTVTTLDDGTLEHITTNLKMSVECVGIRTNCHECSYYMCYIAHHKIIIMAKVHIIKD